MAKRRSKTSKYVSGKIPKLRREGYKQKQAIAIAYSMARRRGKKRKKR